MKTEQEINDARERLRKRILTPGLNDCQKALVTGMLNALVWAADGPNANTMDRMLSDEPLAAGKDSTPALKRIDDLRSGFICPKCGQPLAHSRLRGMFCMTCR